MTRLAPELEDEIRSIGRRVVEAGHLLAIRAVPFSARPAVEPVLDPELRRFVYVEVADDLVDVEVRTAALKTAAWCAGDLLLDRVPDLRWMIPECGAERRYVAQFGVRDWPYVVAGKRPVRGLCIREEQIIWLDAALDVDGAIRTAAHECRHAAEWTSRSTFEDEVEAVRYENQTWRAIGERIKF